MAAITDANLPPRSRPFRARGLKQGSWTPNAHNNARGSRFL